MTPERFRQIEELYHAARDVSADERAALLAKTDPDLRREVESLLAEPIGGEFMDRPAFQNAPELLEDSTVTAFAVSLGPYRIQSKLGEGGMGEVFRAIDTRLGRAVAIKTTREQFSSRFEREARAISSLNHPNICTLFDVGPNYLVMELVEGETIAARLKSGPLPEKIALLYASQIIAALAEAHGKGVVHRDLKPGNIMIAKSGIKVLDFGLAKSGQDETITASHMVLGTPAYMAPEQREGKPADTRSDIYSFGCVLYEMLTGARAGQLRKRIPSGKLEKIVSRCLEQDPSRRWQSVAELERELGSASAATGLWEIVAAAAVTLALVAGAYLYLHRTSKLTDKDTIVLADFTNTTGDPVFDGTLRQGLSIQLEQSPFLSIVSDDGIHKVLGLMGQKADARLTPELAREICERNASAAVLDGSIASLGSQFVVGLRARNCRTGDVLDQEQVQAAKKEDVLNALSQIASKFRARIGESLATVKQHDTPLAEATTPSIEALKLYSAAFRVHFSSDPESIPLVQRAIEIDPQFALAYAFLGREYAQLGESDLAAENNRKAYELRDRTSELERFFITATYHMQVTGNMEKAQENFELWAQTYPRDQYPHGLLSGGIYPALGKYERAVEQARRVIEINPDGPFGYGNLAVNLMFLDRLDEAETVYQEVTKRKLEIPDILVNRYDLAFLRRDQSEMERQVSLGLGKAVSMSEHEANALAYFGHLQQAKMMSRQGIDMAKKRGRLERAAVFEGRAAVREAFFGNAPEARRGAMAALGVSKNKELQSVGALALALSGESSRSQTIANDLEKRFPEDTEIRFSVLPELRALLALNPADPSQGKPANAIEALQVALPDELGVPFSFYGALYPVYVRGLSYLAAHQGTEAAVEFRKILDHRGIVHSDPIGALANLQLGRAFALSGDKLKAKSAYRDFFALWKDADSDIPIFKQAKAEYAELR
jgi:tetratricopeptide (TPR) repeat protein